MRCAASFDLFILFVWSKVVGFDVQLPVMFSWLLICSVAFDVNNNNKIFIMRLSQFCENKLQAQYSFTYQAQYIAKKYMN